MKLQRQLGTFGALMMGLGSIVGTGVFARIDAAGTTPYVAVIVMGTVIALLALVSNVRTTWSFSAFTVLIYYAITNLAALRLPQEAQRFPRWVAVAGVVACLFLAFWVKAAGLGQWVGAAGVGVALGAVGAGRVMIFQ